MSNSWLLPEFIADILPAEARRLEEMRRVLLDCFHRYGYELVIPPLLEHLDSLLTGAGHDLELYTFKLIDQLSGRTLGVRADITPQVARIDAHLLNSSEVTRLCYAGSVLHTKPSGLYASREPLQIGAEIYGYADIEADLEIQELMLAALRLIQVGPIHLDLCHVAILASLLADVELDKESEDDLYLALAAKDISWLKRIIRFFPEAVQTSLLVLPSLYGEPEEVLQKAYRTLPNMPIIHNALAQLELAAKSVRQYDDVQVHFDLTDLRGYQYHTGLTFVAYIPGAPDAIARGGRYDKIGQAFGRARPATGFSLDLRSLANLVTPQMIKPGILAPWDNAHTLKEKIAELREQGEVVLQLLPNQKNDKFSKASYDRMLIPQADKWVIVPRTN